MDNWLIKYIEVLENLNPENTDKLLGVLAPSVNFKDPFNNTYTRAEFISIMQDMFNKLSLVRFEVHQSIQEQDVAFIHWTFHGASKVTGDFSFEGTSVLKVDEVGKVIQHHDYWDGSALMQKVPLLGRVIYWLRHKLAH
jgi:hypothetical protein